MVRRRNSWVSWVPCGCGRCKSCPEWFQEGVRPQERPHTNSSCGLTRSHPKQGEGQPRGLEVAPGGLVPPGSSSNRTCHLAQISEAIAKPQFSYL